MGVLEADDRREAGHPLAGCLVGDVAGADAVVGDQPVDVLRRQGVQRLGRDRNTQLRDRGHEHPGRHEPDADPAGAVQERVVGETLPVDLGPRLLGVRAHEDLEVVAVPLAHPGDEGGVLQRGGRVVDRARAGDDGQPVVGAGDDASDGAAARPCRGGGCGRQGDDGGDRRRGDDDAQAGDARVHQVTRVDSFCRVDAQLPLDAGQQLRVGGIDLRVHPRLHLEQGIGDPRRDVQDPVARWRSPLHRSHSARPPSDAIGEVFLPGRGS